MKTQNSVSQKIRILHKINKNDILNRNVRLLKSMFNSMHSILGLVSFCMNYCINAAWHEDNQPVALFRCYEAQVTFITAFRSSVLLGLVSLIFLLTISHRFSMWFRSGEFAGQSSSNTMVIEPAFGSFGSAGRCQVLLENDISISIKLVSRRTHEVLYNVLVDGCVDCGLQKTQWANTSRWHAAQIITDCGNFTLDFKQHGFCASPLFLQTLRPWFPNEMQYLLLKRGLWTTEQQSSSFSP